MNVQAASALEAFGKELVLVRTCLAYELSILPEQPLKQNPAGQGQT